MIPQTDALQAPADAPNPYGSGMHHTILYRRLKTIVPNLWMPMPEHYAGWFPGKESGITCIWVGEPAMPGSKKICAITLGAIPEFTIKDERGGIKQKGWRAIFARLIRARACTKRDLETAFLVNLDRDTKKGDGLCYHCARAGKRVKATGAKRLCKLHERIQSIVARGLEKRKENKWLATLSPEKRAAYLGLSFRVTLDIASTPSTAKTSRSSSAARRAAGASSSTRTTGSIASKSSSLVSPTGVMSSS